MGRIGNWLQMLAMQGPQAPPTTGPAPQLPEENVPRRTFDPLQKGAGEAINSVRESIGARPKPGRFSPLFQLANEVGSAMLKSSENPMAQQFGHMPLNLHAAQDQHADENMKIMQYLQKAEQAKRQHEMQSGHYAEQSRHNKAMEGMYSDRAMKPSKEELNETAIQDLQKKIPGAIPLNALPQGARTDAHKELRGRANAPSKLYAVQKTLDEMVNIVEKHPDLSTSLSAALFPKEYGGGAIATAKLKAMPHDKRVAIERLNKLANDLVLKQVHGLGTQRATIFMEKIMQASNPHYGLSPEAVRAIRDSQKQSYDYAVADGKAARAAMSGGYYLPTVDPESLEAEEEPQQQAEEPQMAAANPEANQNAMATEREQLLKRRQELLQSLGGQQ